LLGKHLGLFQPPQSKSAAAPHLHVESPAELIMSRLNLLAQRIWTSADRGQGWDGAPIGSTDKGQLIFISLPEKRAIVGGCDSVRRLLTPRRNCLLFPSVALSLLL
jgi:hypothetical protein